jgi:hypothetical protein
MHGLSHFSPIAAEHINRLESYLERNCLMALCPQHSNCLVRGYAYCKYRWDFGDSILGVLHAQGQYV